MQLKPEAFHDRLSANDTANNSAKSGATPAAAWIHGNEPLLVIEAADAFRARARADGFTEREVLHIERGVSASDLLSKGGSQSLFGDKQLLELRLKTGKLLKDMGEALATLAATAHDDLRILVTSERLERGVAETAWFKRFDSNAWVVAIYPVERNQLGSWLAARIQLQKQFAEKHTIDFIAERVEGNLLAAQQELRKLALLYPPGPLPHAEIEANLASVSRYSPFDLADAAISGDGSRAIRSLDGLRAEAAPLPIIVWALADATRQLYRLAHGISIGQPMQSALKALRVPFPRERILERAANRLNTTELLGLLQKLSWADKMSKGIPVAQHADAWQLLADVVMRIAAPKPSTRLSPAGNRLPRR